MGISDAKSRVPSTNSTTAILFVDEMPHMPQRSLLGAVLPQMLRASQAWKKLAPGASPPRQELDAVLAAVSKEGCWNGRLMHTGGRGEWVEAEFGGRTGVRSHPRVLSAAVLGGA